MRCGPHGQMFFFSEPTWIVVQELQRGASRWQFDGRETEQNVRYLARCTADHLPSGSRLMFSRDCGHHTSGWFKNPDFERCLHLSVSFREPDTGGMLPHSLRRSLEWARLFFRDDTRYVWSEPPHSKMGKEAEVWHYRLFCDEHWRGMKPRGEVYSREFTEKGWLSASELGNVILSTLSPG